MEVLEGTRETTKEEIENYYRELDEKAARVVILNKELKFLIDFCKLENNGGLYYPNELWNEFQSKIAIAEEVYSKGEDSIEVSNAFWNLMFAYNDICIVNQVPGDVDFDGEVSILDATIVQRFLAKLCDLNSSQLLILDKGRTNEVTVLDATEIQRFLAKLQSNLDYKYLPSSQTNLGTHWKKNLRMQTQYIETKM